ncbi:MAG: phosphoribosyltransferase-like protein [Sulfurovaceae bacterium]
MNFSLPENWEDNIQDIVERCYDLIDIGYFNKLDKSGLDAWLSNFETQEERYLAAQMLNNLHYRNEKTLITMFKQILQVYLPQKLRELKIFEIESIEKWEKTLSSTDAYKLPFRFSTINKEGRIGESGDALFRLYTQYGLVEKGIGRFINDIKCKHCNTIILIDDFTGTGNQFKVFYKKYQTIFDKFEYIIYAPLVAHESAINSISGIAKNIHLITAETIKNDNGFYGLKDKANNNKNFCELCDKILERFSKKNKPISPYGYKNQANLYVFSISTPNNNHSFLYHNKYWNQLFKR